MPTINGKKFPYSKKGKMAAKSYAKKKKKKMKGTAMERFAASRSGSKKKMKGKKY